MRGGVVDRDPCRVIGHQPFDQYKPQLAGAERESAAECSVVVLHKGG